MRLRLLSTGACQKQSMNVDIGSNRVLYKTYMLLYPSKRPPIRGKARPRLGFLKALQQTPADLGSLPDAMQIWRRLAHVCGCPGLS